MTGDDAAVVLLSGGMDSATAAYETAADGFALHALHISYGQTTADIEATCARDLAAALDVEEFLTVDTEHLQRIGGSSLTDAAIPVADADVTSETIPTSYVPFRNANLLSMAVSFAETAGCSRVVIGAHSEDYAGYPDCRPAFFDAFQHVADLGTKPETSITIASPFATWSKTEIVQRGSDLGVPFGQTWSCYRQAPPACGTCDSCAYRLEAFANAGLTDPIEYEPGLTH
jgi:7-cyano-7-deazaguanine synthase